MGKQSKQMGVAISRLINVAQQVKKAEQPQQVAQQAKPTDWRTVAMKQSATIKAQAELLKAQQADLAKLQGRKTIANYSVEDIEKELMRRLEQIGT